MNWTGIVVVGLLCLTFLIAWWMYIKGTYSDD